MDGFVHNAEGYANSCAASGNCSGNFTDLTGQRAMGYYDQGFLNYYYYMASQFALSNRWFSPVSSKSITNRIATFTGGTTQGLVLDPGNEDKQSTAGHPDNLQQARQGQRFVEDLLHGQPGLLPKRSRRLHCERVERLLSGDRLLLAVVLVQLPVRKSERRRPAPAPRSRRVSWAMRRIPSASIPTTLLR